MICKNCGNELRVGDVFCLKCGSAIQNSFNFGSIPSKDEQPPTIENEIAENLESFEYNSINSRDFTNQESVEYPQDDIVTDLQEENFNDNIISAIDGEVEPEVDTEYNDAEAEETLIKFGGEMPIDETEIPPQNDFNEVIQDLKIEQGLETSYNTPFREVEVIQSEQSFESDDEVVSEEDIVENFNEQIEELKDDLEEMELQEGEISNGEVDEVQINEPKEAPEFPNLKEEDNTEENSGQKDGSLEEDLVSEEEVIEQPKAVEEDDSTQKTNSEPQQDTTNNKNTLDMALNIIIGILSCATIYLGLQYFGVF